MSDVTVLGPSGARDTSRNVLFLFPDWDAATWTASLSALSGAPTANLVTRQPALVAGYDVSVAAVTLSGARTAAALGAVCIPYATATTAATWRIRAGNSAGEAAGTSAFDATAHARHGTITGAVFAAGKYGGGLLCDGESRIVAPFFETAEDVSYLCWVKLDAYPEATVTLVEHDFVGATFKVQVLIDGTLRVNGSSATDSAQKLVPGVWSHVAIVRLSPEIIRVYLDGENVADGSLGGTGLAGSGGVTWGNLSTPGTATGIVGTLDDLRIYDRVLLGAEIQAAMQAEPVAPLDANLQVAYALNGYDSGTLTFGAPPNLATYTRRLGFHRLAYDLTASVLRVTLTDPGNAALRIGRLVAGEVYQPDNNFEFGFQLGHKDDTKQSRTPTGQTTTKSSVPVPFCEFTLRHNARSAIMLHCYEMQRRYGTSRPFVVCCDPGDDEFLQMLTLYGLADDLSAMPWQWANGWDASWRFVAML